jgi:hypothetical protein
MAERVIYRNVQDPIVRNQLARKVQQIENYRTTISRLAGQDTGTDPRRDIAEECGHPKTSQITVQDYQDLYDRNPIAKKANDLLPNHCWQVHPDVLEDEDPEKETAFEEAMLGLSDNLGEEEESHSKDKEGDPFWSYLQRADRLCGIGHYGTILIGVEGQEGKDLSQPLKPSKTPRKLIYLRVFTEHLSPIVMYETDTSSKRYGKPSMYQMNFDDTSMGEISTDSSVTPSQGSEKVHWTRVIHVTDELSSNEVLHIPRLRPSYNRYVDLDKLYGCSAEMYYKGAFPGYHFGTHPSLGGDVDVDESAMQNMVEEWMNGLQRSVITSGYEVNSLSPQVVDPTPQIEAALDAICIEKDCPKRIFLGSERGELASGQDKDHWDRRLDHRRNKHLTPRLIIPVLNRFIWLGILPAPLEGFGVEWPEIDSMNMLDKAKIAQLKTQAIVAFLQGDGEMVLPLASFLTLILGFTDKEAEAIMDTLEEEEAEETLRQKVAMADEERHAEQAERFMEKQQASGPNGKKLPNQPSKGKAPNDSSPVPSSKPSTSPKSQKKSGQKPPKK